MSSSNHVAQKSFSGAIWKLRQVDDRLSKSISQRYQIPAAISDILVGRGITEEEVADFLNPTLRHFLPNPSQFKDMDKAAARIVEAIQAKEQMAVFGDYDVDGATSSALWARFMKAIGHQITLYIPDRMKEGYGPNPTALLALQAKGISLVMTVDCGISAFEALEVAANHHLDVIVIDHHQAGARLPDAFAIVNPNRLDEAEGFGHLAAVGVCYLTIIAVNRLLRDQGYYQKMGLKEPDLKLWLDLVALGTVCDVVKLKGLNRAFVSQGLKIMNARHNIGINALFSVSAIEETPSAYHCGFQLGPRVNAGGRVGESYLGANLLSSDDHNIAKLLANQLDNYNQERKTIEQFCLEEAQLQQSLKIENALKTNSINWMVFTASHGWHAGVIGIVAGRLKEMFGLPSLVLAIGEDGICKGSARSVEGVDIGQIIAAARDSGILINGGGHAMAAGLSVREENLEQLEIFLNQEIAFALNNQPIQPCVKLDGMIHPAAVGLDLLDQLDALAPFGAGNPEPHYCLYPARVRYAKVVGLNHISLSLSGEDGGSIGAIAFRALDLPFGEKLMKAVGGQPLAFAGKFKRNRWQGTDKVQMIIEDVASLDIFKS